MKLSMTLHSADLAPEQLQALTTDLSRTINRETPVQAALPEEPKLQALACPGRDVAALSELLLSPERGQFADARKLIDEPHHRVTCEIYDALNGVSRDDLLLIYYSGHGKLNRAGKLCLATADTVLSALEATSIPVNTIREYLLMSPAATEWC